MMTILSLLDPTFGDWSDVQNKKNVLALFVVIKFVVVVGFVSFLIWTIRKNAAAQCPDVSDLLAEIEQEEIVTNEPNSLEEKNSETEKEWERDSDWWKNQTD